MMQSEGIETNSRPSLFLCLSHGRVSVRSFPPKISIYGTCSHMGNPHPRIHYAASLLSVKYSYATYYSLVMYDTHDSKPVVYCMYTDSYGNCRPTSEKIVKKLYSYMQAREQQDLRMPPSVEMYSQ